MTIEEQKLEAQHKAIDALARYKFMMFGYWAALWTHLNNLGSHKDPNPLAPLVQEARRLRGLNPTDILTQDAQKRGLSLEEPDDDTLELRQHGKAIARFSQTGVEVDNVLKEIQQPGNN
jgi:hypothetical protein